MIEEEIPKPQQIYEGDTHRIYLYNKEVKVKFYYQSPPKRKIKLSRLSSIKVSPLNTNYVDLINQRRDSMNPNQSLIQELKAEQNQDPPIISDLSGRKKCYNPRDLSERFYFDNMGEAERTNRIMKQYEEIQMINRACIADNKRKVVRLKLFKNQPLRRSNRHLDQTINRFLLTISQRKTASRHRQQGMKSPEYGNKENIKVEHRISQMVNRTEINLSEKRQKQHMGKNWLTLTRKKDAHRSLEKNDEVSRYLITDLPFQTQYHTPIKDILSQERSQSRSKSKKGISIVSKSPHKLYPQNDRWSSEKPLHNRVNNPIQRLKSKSRFLRYTPSTQNSLRKRPRVISSEKIPNKQKIEF